ncbi:MAG: DUF3299 domain-containing protein [Planctomycetota bacterium]
MAAAALTAACDLGSTETFEGGTRVNVVEDPGPSEAPERPVGGQPPAGLSMEPDPEARPSAGAADVDPASGANGELSFRLLDMVRSVDLIEPFLAFPDSLIALDGRRVELKGFMAPYDSLESMQRCMIVPSYVGCTFCSPPDLTQVVFVTQGAGDDPDGAFPFIEPLSQVSGVLRLSFAESEHEGATQGFIYSLEDAEVREASVDTPDRAPTHSSSPHDVMTADVEPTEASALVAEVAELVGLAPLRPIEIESVPSDAFVALLRSEQEAALPEPGRTLRTRVFRRLGMLTDTDAWLDRVVEFQLTRRVAAVDAAGERIRLRGSVPELHPYARLDLVGEIAVALVRQHQGGPGVERPAGPAATDDARRAREALMEGLRTMTVRRYATARGIPSSPPLPSEIQERVAALNFGRWLATPRFCGYFFVRALIGDAGPLAGLAEVLAEPPTSTVELFRPRWYLDGSRWRPDPVPADFADGIEDTPPAMTDVLGVGGLVPFLTQWYSLDEAMVLIGSWTGDRWAVWERPDGAVKVLLELRLGDEAAALAFRDAIPDDATWTLAPHWEGSGRVRLTSEG